MRTHIDWLTFTCAPLFIGDNQFDLAGAIIEGLYALIGRDIFNRLFTGKGEQKDRSRAPYTYAWAWADAHVTVYASENLNHFTVEISGQGCEKLLSENVLESLLQRVVERVTRIDVACDVETPVTPAEFVKNLSHKRMTASGYQKSASGETCYVGSQKSERYARVYRYNDPHPRSHLLRIEHVFRRDHAKVVAREIVGGSIRAVADAAGKTFGWSHGVWETSQDSSVDISVISSDRAAGKTVYWLVNSVAPSFKRLCQGGDIKDAEGFLRKYFLT